MVGRGSHFWPPWPRHSRWADARSSEPVQQVERVWIRLGAVETAPAAAYFNVYGGPTADRLIQVSSEVNTRTELHESMTMGNMSVDEADQRGR